MMKPTVVIIEGSHCYQLCTKTYLYFSLKVISVCRQKLLGAILCYKNMMTFYHIFLLQLLSKEMVFSTDDYIVLNIFHCYRQY